MEGGFLVLEEAFKKWKKASESERRLRKVEVGFRKWREAS